MTRIYHDVKEEEEAALMSSIPFQGCSGHGISVKVALLPQHVFDASSTTCGQLGSGAVLTEMANDGHLISLAYPSMDDLANWLAVNTSTKHLNDVKCLGQR